MKRGFRETTISVSNTLTTAFLNAKLDIWQLEQEPVPFNLFLAAHRLSMYSEAPQVEKEKERKKGKEGKQVFNFEPGKVRRHRMADSMYH